MGYGGSFQRLPFYSADKEGGKHGKMMALKGCLDGNALCTDLL